MNSMFSDEKLYKKLNKDPTKIIEKQCKNLIKELVEKKAISQMKAIFLKNNNCISPKAYGLRKTHKVGTIAYRPIVSNIGSPCYNLSKYVHEQLSLICSTFHRNMKNSFQVAQLLADVTIPTNHVLISLDVVSLFPSIPKELVIKKIKEKWNWLENYLEITRDLFIKLIQFMFDSSYFRFDGQFYKQLDGTMMGSPASPSIANFIMEIVISDVLDSLNFKPGIQLYYVDDSLYSVPEDKVTTFVNTFNSYHPSLKFTYELEDDRKLAFLDLEVVREENGKIDTKWYMKPTASGRIVNFHSSHPTHQKVNIVKNMLHRASELSSSQYVDEGIQRIREILGNNNYPKYFYNKIINEFLVPRVHTNDSSNTPEMTTRCIFPNIPGLTNNIKKLLLTDGQCQLISYNVKTTNCLFSKLKDQEPRNEQKEVVYKISCKECPCVYIGETRQKISARIKQHTNTCKPMYVGGQTALSEHAHNTKHSFDFDGYKIVGKESVDKKRKLLEVIQIIRHQNTINFKTDTECFAGVYNSLLKRS